MRRLHPWESGDRVQPCDCQELPIWGDISATSAQRAKFEGDSATCRTRTNAPSLLLSSIEAKSRVGSELIYSAASKRAGAPPAEPLQRIMDDLDYQI